MGQVSAPVREEDTATMYDADLPKVASTPFVLGLAERSCLRAMDDFLEQDQISVGTTATISHLRASKVGSVLVAKSTLIERDGRRFSFEITVWDGDDVCASIEPVRAIVDRSSIDA